MSTEITALAPQILEVVKKSKKILLHCHPAPDPDSVGGVLAMSFALKQLGKDVTIIAGDSPFPESMLHFPGADAIVQKNFLEIELKDFDLFIVQDASSVQMISKKADVVFPDSLKVVVIDHHITNTKFGRINLVEPDYPAVCLILFDLFNLWDIEITHDIALNLFMGIYTDTGFKYPGTTSYCFDVASKLTTIAPDFPSCIFLYENSADRKTIEFLGLALTHIETFNNDSIAVIGVSYDDLQKADIDSKYTLAHLSNMLISVKQWQIGASLIESEPNTVKVSLRTRDSQKYDLSKLALALGGGGHPAAAGATLNLPLKEAKEFFLKTVWEIYS